MTEGLSSDRLWNTWDPRFAGGMVHLPSQIVVKVSTFSNRTGRYEDYQQSSKIRFGHHTSDGSFVEFDLLGEGSIVNVQIAKPDAQSVVLRSSVKSTSEWALRFWTLIEIGVLPPTFAEKQPRSNAHKVRLHVPDTGLYGAKSLRIESVRGGRVFRGATSPRPVRCELYDELDELRTELDERGYYFPHPDQQSGNWAVMRFSAQEQPTVNTVMVEAANAEDAERRVIELLANADDVVDDARADSLRGSADTLAVRDVVAWNTLWDAPNSRCFTALSRGWVFDKFGGWGVWLNDIFYHSLMAVCVGDEDVAIRNLNVVMSGQQPNGMLPCLLTAYTQWIDRSQPPISAYIVHRLALRLGDTALTDKYFEQLLAAHDWWFANRDGNHDGLLEWGSSPVGHGTFVHSKQAAMDESAMDNLPVFDEATFDHQTHTLDQADVGLNSLLVLEVEILTDAAKRLGRLDVAQRLSLRGEELKHLISTRMWDSNSEIFANLNWDGTFASKHAPTSFYPMLAGIASEDQIEKLVSLHLTPDQRFGGSRPVPSTPRDDPASKDNVYWRGRIWPPLAFLTWDGLHRAGRHTEAANIVKNLYAMFVHHFEQDRRCLENYHLNDPALDVTQDSDPFYTWGALIPLMSMLERADVSPWEGIVLNPDRDEPARIAIGGSFLIAAIEGDSVVVRSSHGYLAVISPPSRISNLVANPTVFGLRAPSSSDLTVRFESQPGVSIHRVSLDGIAVDGTSAEIHVPAKSMVRFELETSH